MTPKELLDGFEALADAPNGVACLRDLVLQLAVQGKLVPQEPKDEPASKLLERIATEKARLAKEGKITRPKPLPEALDGCVVRDLPSGWAAEFLANCLSWDLTDGDWVESKDQDPAGSIRLTQLADVGVDKFKDVSQRFLNEETAERLRCTFLKPGDLLIARLPNPLGRACVFPGLSQACVTVVDVAIGRSGRAALNQRYLVHMMNSPVVLERVEELSAGTTRKRVSTGNLRKIVLPIPPLAEQERIVTRVDELMALLDRLEAAQGSRETTRQALREAALSALRDADDPETLQSAWIRIADQMEHLVADSTDMPTLRQTILQLAVRGRLVPQAPDDEPASLLLDRVAATETLLVKQQEITKPKSLPPIEPGEVPFGLPEGWLWARLQSLVDPSRGISYGIIKLGSDPGSKGVATLRCSDVRWRYIDRAKIRRVEKELSDEYARTILEGGELVVNIRGTLGGCAVVPKDMAGYNVAREVAVVPTAEVFPRFLCEVLASPLFQRFTDNSLRGIAYKGLNLSLLRNFLVPLPPLGEQQRIVAKVDELMRHCDDLEAGLQRAQSTRASFATSAVANFA